MSAYIPQRWVQSKQVVRAWTRAAMRSIHWTVSGAWTLLSHWCAAQCHPDYVVEIIAPRPERDGGLDTLALENLFQSLLLTAREPVALEIYGTPHERRLLARATSVRSLRHLCAQLRAHAPQVEMRQVSPPRNAMAQRAPGDLNLTPSSLTYDPLSLRASERMRALELRLRGGAHLPLKLYQRDELSAQGVDPLLGVLAAMDGLPPEGCAVAQLTLALAPARWSRRQQRLAVEHPLAQEQARERAQLRATTANSVGGSGYSGGTGVGALAPLALLALVGLALYTHLYPHAASIRLDPPYLLALVESVTRPVTRLAPSGLLLPLIIAALALVFTALALRARLAQTSIYSMRLVEERTTPIAARMRLTLFAIAPVAAVVTNPPSLEHEAPSLQTADEEQKPEKAMSQFAYGMRRVNAFLNAHISAWIMTQRAHSAVGATLDQTLMQLVAAYRQHHLASGAHFVPRRRWVVWPTLFTQGWARRARHSRDLLNVRELAALWHPPQGETETPLLERGRAHTLLAPIAPLAHGYRIGHSTQANLSAPVRLPTQALRHNTLLVAKTGKGKSSLLLHLALAQLAPQDRDATPLSDTAFLAAAAGKPRSRLDHREGLVVIDPHGDLVNTLLTLVPTERRDDVILVDLADIAYPVALNPLDALFGRDRDKAVESLLAVLSQIWAKFWGPRMQNALEYALKTLYEANETLIARDPQQGPDQQFTLLDVAPILSAPGFRRDVLSLTQDQALRTWWTHYYQPLDFRLQLEIINPVLTKIAAFSGSRVARRIVGQGRSTLDPGEIVRSGQILLVNTAKGVVGAETATLIGATLLGALQASLEEQGRLAPEQRRHFLTIIDEFQTLLGVDYAALLSELRKFGGTFALATQTLAHLDALDPTLRPTTLANVDALYAFAVSAEDARTLTHELDEVVTPIDLINQDDFHCYAKLTLEGRRLPVFSLALDPPPVGDPTLAAQLRARARLRYARPLAVVEAALALAAARYLPRHETGATQDTQDTLAPLDDGSSQSDASQAREVHDEGATVSFTAAQKDTDMMSGIAPRTAQRGRFGRRPRAGGSRGKREGAPTFDLWAELLGDSEVDRQATSTNPANPETGDGEEVES